jgi:hypothetical protein
MPRWVDLGDAPGIGEEINPLVVADGGEGMDRLQIVVGCDRTGWRLTMGRNDLLAPNVPQIGRA